METVREILVVLARRHAFRELAHLVGLPKLGLGLSRADVAAVQQLCAYGQRLLDLDAEDLANPDAAAQANTDSSVADLVHDMRVPAHLMARGRLCYIRRSPDERAEDALVSLHPAFRLLLEVISIRYGRNESSSLVAAIHIASEYASLLAWQTVLGHAGDPLRLRRDHGFTGPHSRWGHNAKDSTSRPRDGLPDPIQGADELCRHPKPYGSAARRVLRVADEPMAGWQSYLDRQHSTVSHALGFCATECRNPCAVFTTRTQAQRDGLTERCGLAVAFGQSAIVRLRHSAPVGHGFGVPSPAEIVETWQRSRESLAKRGGLAETILTEDGFVLPGLPSYFSAIASVALTPDTLITDTAVEVERIIDRPRSP